MIDFSIKVEGMGEIGNMSEEWRKGLVFGFRDAMLMIEGKAKGRFGKAGNIKARTGHYRRSINTKVTTRGNDLIGTLAGNVVYACIFDGRTRVTTDKGQKEISRIKVGDMVLTQTGEFKVVKHKHKFSAVNKPNLVEITTNWRKDKNHIITVTEDHKILVYRDGRNKWVEACELLLTDKMFDVKKKSHNKDTGLKFKCINCGKITNRNKKEQFLCSSKCKLEWWAKGNNPHIGMKRTEEACNNMSKSRMKILEDNPKSHPNYILAQNGYMTSIEKKVLDVLINKDEEYEYQYRIGKYWADFYLPKKNLVIEVDGAYWHQDQTKDIKRDKYIVEKLPGVKIIHIHFYNKRYTPKIDVFPMKNVYYSVCNPNINSHVDLDTFRTVDILKINKFKYEKSNNKYATREGMLYDLTIEGIHSFLANGLLVSNSTHEYGATIFPKVGKCLRFPINGHWVSVKKVVIPKRPLLTPSVTENVSEAGTIIINRIVKEME